MEGVCDVAADDGTADRGTLVGVMDVIQFVSLF
jgi:hypothetical protein